MTHQIFMCTLLAAKKQEKLKSLEERPPIEVERSKLKAKILRCASQRVAILRDYEVREGYSCSDPL